MTGQTSGKKSADEAALAIEGFRILEKLASGATASVWKAEQISLNRTVVIKVLSERLTHRPEDVTLFKAEARTAATFKHPGIVQVYDFGQSKTGRRYYFVMEYISGYSVGDWIRRRGRITEHEALVIAQSVTEALKYAWDIAGIVHCDIKPDNIMVDGDGSIKVADLGLAHTVRSMGAQPRAEAVEVVITGTPNYMAPEQVRGTEPIDCRTDIYALGATLYHIVTGQLPFGDSPPDTVLERQLQETFEYPQKINPDLSTAVTRLIVKMTAKDPAARFQTWDEVLAEVVRLERQMRQRAAPAVKTSAVSTAAPAAGASPASFDTKDKSAVKEPVLTCRACGSLIQLKSLYCGSCGRPVNAPEQEKAEDRKQVTIRLKPIQDVLPPQSRSGAFPEPLFRPQSAEKHRRISLGGNIRMLLTLGLLVFMGYYAYQKTKYDRDIMIPIKAAVIWNFRSMSEHPTRYFENCLQKGAQWSHKMIWSRFTGGAPPSEASSRTVPQATAADESETPADSSEWASAEEPAIPSDQSSSGERDRNEATAVSQTSFGEATSPGESSAVKSPQDEEYERILQTCRQHQPKTGELVTLRIKNEQQPVEGIFEHTTPEGIMLKVPSGVIEYPFSVMADESRLMFFPEERARRIQRQQSP